jgi:hypothetical protein
MRSQIPNFRLCGFFLALTILFAVTNRAQQKPKPSSSETSITKPQFPAAKKQVAQGTSADDQDDLDKASSTELDKDSAEQIRRRDEWFYKQRSSVNGRIPAGARFKAFQHMQRMMVAEGKLVLRPGGSYAEVAPQPLLSPQSAVTSTWASIGPTPTTGGTFSPVTGRITTIAVDPSDSTANTVLIGGAQGGIWRSTDAGATWTAVGDQSPSLAMGSIAFASSQPATVYAGTGEQASIGFDIYYGAGVLKSNDHGQTWTPTCTVAGPTCPFIGPYLDTLHPGFGFFNFGGARISYIAVNPQNPNLILAAAQLGIEGPTEGIYCSSDGGATWANIFPDEMATFVGFASSTVAFAAFGMPFGSSPRAPHGNGIYKSTNANSCSVTFSPLAGGLPIQTSIGRIDLGISPNYASDNTVYASIADATTSSTTNLGIWITTNGGTSWTQTSAPDICQHQCWYDNVIKVDPLHGDTAFFGGAAIRDTSGNPNWVVRTTNSGASWASVIPALPALGQPANSGVPHVDNHAIALVKLPNGKVRLYLGNDGGIWRTDDAEASTITWTNLNNSPLSLSQFYPSISIHSANPMISYGGTQDNSSQQLATPPSWIVNTGTVQTSSGPVQTSVCGDGTATAIDPNIPTTVYVSCQFTNIRASYQNGAPGSFFVATNGINPQDPAGFVPILVADLSTPNVVYTATNTLYQSLDAARTWNPIYFGIADPVNGIDLTAFAIGGTNSSVFYAGKSDGTIWIAKGVTFGNTPGFQGTSGQFSLPSRTVTAIAVDPADNTGNTAYASFSGFSFVGPDALNPNITINDPQGHVFKTTDGGTTWTDISCSVVSPSNCSKPAANDLPNIPVNDVVVDPELPGVIYVASDLGVFVSNCSASPCTWSTLGTGLPRVAVLSMRLHDPSRTLRAATHGRGVWDLNLNNFSFSGPHISTLSPTSVNAASASFTLIVTGNGLTGGAIQWNGSTTGVTMLTGGTDSSLSATIANSLFIAGTAQITVHVGSSTSNALPFSVLALTPTVTSINPSSTPVQSPAQPSNVPIQVSGTNFAASARVLFNSAQNGITVAAPTSSCPLPTCLSATLPSSLLVGYGSTNSISVLNLPPGGGQSNSVNFQVVAPPPPNDNIANAINISTLSFNDFQDTSGATTESTDPIPSCVTQFTAAQGNTGGHPNGVYNTIWYKFTPPFSANLFVETSFTTYDAVLSMWTRTQGNLVQVACNDDIHLGVNAASQLSNVPLTAGTTYYIMVSSFGPPDTNPLALGGRSDIVFSYNNGFTPAPTLTSVSPNSANSGDPDVNLTITGSGFLNGAFAQFTSGFSGYTTTLTITTTLQTTFVSSTQLTAVLPASAIALPTNGQITVSNPLPQFGGSNSLPFTVNLGTYPVPALNSIFPSIMIAGSVPFGISANGSNFATTAVLNFNGVPKPTTAQNSQNLSATISQADIASAGTAQVTVSNPTPGGGPSAPQPFTVTQPTVIPNISSVSPSSGPANSPINLTITGTGFLPGAFLYFAGINYSTNVSSSTQLTGSIQSPVGTGSYALYVVDPAPAGTSAPFNFTVTGPPDFSVASSGTTMQTVSAGQTATFTNVITVAPQNGFSAQVNLSCSLPVAATATTCTVNPNSFATGSGTSSVMVTTMARGLVPPSWPRMRFIFRPQFLPVLLLTILLSLHFLRLARTRRQRFVGAIPLAGLLLFLTLQAIGCGGGSYSQPPPPPPPTGTQAGTYTVTVTATSGSLTHSATVTLVVQ